MPTKRIKRFELGETYTRGIWHPAIVEHEQGDYVLHVDYAKLEERVLALTAGCQHDLVIIGWERFCCKKCGVIFK